MQYKIWVKYSKSNKTKTKQKINKNLIMNLLIFLSNQLEIRESIKIIIWWWWLLLLLILVIMLMLVVCF
jgi:hypothetical protein